MGIKKKLNSLLVWLMIGSLSLISFFGLNLSKAQAAEPQTPIVSISFDVNNKNYGLENVKYPSINVVLDEIATSDITCEYEITGGTATLNTDYKLTGDLLTISTGKISSNIPLEIADNNTVGEDKTIEISLSNALGANIVTPSVFTYTIIDDDVLPVTKVITISPDGDNGWFVTEPMVTFTVDPLATTYYQWNNTDDTLWKTYKNVPLDAEEGINILYFYSVDTFGNTENIQDRVIKVDTTIPVAPTTFTANTDNNGAVQLSWSAVAGAVSYEIWRDGLLIKKTADISYLDVMITENNTYTYQVIATDEAGNKLDLSLAKSISIIVPKIEKPVIVPVITETPRVETVFVVTPAIASGVSTYQDPQVTEEPKVEEVTPAVEGASTENTDNSDKDQNWNRLLLAISILIIAAGAAVGGYYGYQWFLARREEEGEDKKGPKSKSRW